MTILELKNTIGVTKTIQMVSDTLGLNYYPDCEDMFECCRNNEIRESTKYIAFWYNPDVGFRLKLTKSVYHVDYVEYESLINYVLAFLRFNKELSSQYKLQEIQKDFK